jgi:hypothetical protein
MIIYGGRQAEANKFRHRITVGDGLCFFAGLGADSRPDACDSASDFSTWSQRASSRELS